MHTILRDASQLVNIPIDITMIVGPVGRVIIPYLLSEIC